MAEPSLRSNKERHQARSQHVDSTTYNHSAILVVYRSLLGLLLMRPNFGDNGRVSFVVTNPIVQEGVLDIFRHSRCSHNIVLTFLVVLGADAIVGHVPIIVNRPESARRELARPWVGVGSDYPLEQLHMFDECFHVAEPSRVGRNARF
jgi:hypothetical protein